MLKESVDSLNEHGNMQVLIIVLCSVFVFDGEMESGQLQQSSHSELTRNEQISRWLGEVLKRIGLAALEAADLRSHGLSRERQSSCEYDEGTRSTFGEDDAVAAIYS